MEDYNLINKANCSVPNYPIDDTKIFFDVFVSPQKEACIIGRLDNNYICWCSITHLDDQEINASIFNDLLKTKPSMVSNESNALGTRYSEVKDWHRFCINKRIYQNEYYFYSPVSGCFCDNEDYNKAKFFAGEMNNFYSYESAKCNYRLIDRHYTKILEKYKTILMQNSSAGYYKKMKPIISILEAESYLKLCLNEETRILYLDCVNECSNL